MSNTISKHEVMLFIQKKVGAELNAKEAKELKIDDEYDKVVEETGEDEVKTEVILEDDGLYSQFATMCMDEKENKAQEDEDKKKEKENKVKDKNQAKA